jgi:Omp85 superfamily domain
MKFFIRKLLLLIFLFFFGESYSQSDTAKFPDYFSGKVKVTANKDYERSGFTELFLGKHWRDLWATPFEAGVLDLNKFGGGLTPYKKGGGLQTLSLRLKGNDGKMYKFRSIDKDPAKVLSPDLQETIVADLFKDQISTSNPLAALIVAPMLTEIGVLNAQPIVAVMPDDDKLGEFKTDFGNMLGTIEESPTEGEEGEKGFGESDKIINTFKLYKKLEKDNDNQVDNVEFLKARLFDLLIGDWDRHSDQWLWAGYKQDGKTIYKPIPRDRDQAFCLYDGLFPKIASRSITQIEGYGKDYPKIYDLTFNGRYVDRRFLTPVPKKVYDSLTLFIQEKITDKVIKNAVKKMPAEWYKLEGKNLVGMIESRRDKLKEASEEYYKLINEVVDVYGSNKSEYFDIDILDDDKIDLKVYKYDRKKGEKKGDPFFRRVFDSGVTDEIRLYLNSGKDVVNQNKENETGIDITIIGDKSKILFTGFPEYISDVMSDERPKNNEVERFEPKNENRGYDWRFGPVLSYNTDDGLIFGGGPILYKHGLNAVPYVYRMEFTGSYALNAKSYNLRYTGDFYTLIKGARVLIDIQNTELALTRYFGAGNETTLDKTLENNDYYKVGQELLSISPTFEFPFTKKIDFSINPFYKYSNVSYDQNTYLGQYPGTYGIGGLKYVGVRSNLVYDSRDNQGEPYKGIYAQLLSNYTPEILQNNHTFGKAGLDVRAYISTDTLKGFTFAFRAGGGKIWGEYPFYESIFLGGINSLKGYSRERFAGNGALLAQSEIRLRIGKIKLLIPSMFGISVFGGVGRVYLPDETSHRWHNSYGGSVWLSYFFRAFNIGFTVAKSDEGINYFFGNALFL